MENLNFRENVLRIGHYDIYKKGSASVKNLRILNTGNKYGIMTTKACFNEDGMSFDDRKAIFLERRKKAAADNKYAFDPYKFYMPIQNGEGKAVELTREMVEAYEDGWDLDIKADILITTDKIPGVVAGFPVADCPLLIASDLKNGITATAHCGAAMINNYLPIKTVEALQSMYNSKKEDIYIYIGAHAGKDWSYDRYPDFATEKFWEQTEAVKQIKEDDFRINMDSALLYQLSPEEYETYIINTDNTRTNPNYYSNSIYNHGKGPEDKNGMHFEGAYYQKTKRL